RAAVGACACAREDARRGARLRANAILNTAICRLRMRAVYRNEIPRIAAVVGGKRGIWNPCLPATFTETSQLILTTRVTAFDAGSPCRVMIGNRARKSLPTSTFTTVDANLR